MLTRSRRRLAYLFTLSMGGILVTFAFVVYYFLVLERLRGFDLNLKDETQSHVAEFKYPSEKGGYRVEFGGTLLQSSSDMLPKKLEFACWYNSKKTPLEINEKICQRQDVVKPGFQTIPFNQSGANYQQPLLRQITSPIQNGKNKNGYIIVAKSLESTQEKLAKLRLYFSVGVPTTLGIVGIVGWFLGGVAMKPTKRSYEQ